MVDLILTTFDWVPETPRGYVRDMRVRWALEEAGLPYRVKSVPFRARNAEHFSHQPFGQVPWLTDGDISIFESGAIPRQAVGTVPPSMMYSVPVIDAARGEARNAIRSATSRGMAARAECRQGPS
jgi:glutathione S-transferase